MTVSTGSPPPPFSLTFRSEMDPLPGGGAAYATAVRVAGDTGRAVMAINRFHPNLPKPIGLFADTLKRDARDALADSVAAIKWAELPPAKGGDVSGATLTIEFARGAQIIRRVFNSHNLELIQALGSVLSEIEKVEEQVMTRPLRALALGIKRTAAGFRVAWRNIGSGPLLIADPREPRSPGDPGTRGYVEVTALAPARPGWDPPLPKPIRLELEPATGALKPVTIAPGQALELDTVAWKPTAPGDHVADANWIDYAHPAVDVQAVMESVPDPNRADDGRPYLLRGGAFSPGIDFKGR
jgi:hypothetical protein